MLLILIWLGADALDLCGGSDLEGWEEAAYLRAVRKARERGKGPPMRFIPKGTSL